MSLSESQRELLRYFVSGACATLAHFAALSLLIQVVHLGSAGLANLLAAIVGVGVSFLGSRYFVFRRHTGGIVQQFSRFAALYVLLALMHAGVLFVWTDLWGLDFRIGFVLATALQLVLSFSANKLLVFAR